MEYCLRIALWLFFLIGHIHTKPVCPHSCEQYNFNMDDLGFGFLTSDVSCGHNQTFVSPTNVQKHCYAAALKKFEEGLKDAGETCTDEQGRTADTLQALVNSSERKKCSQPTNCTGCTWESAKTFADFVNDLESLVGQLNSKTDNN